jgi:omega-amidase
MSALTITTMQTGLHWEDKTANLRMLEEKINGIQEKTELVILPEMFSTGFSMQPALLAETMTGETVAWMKRTATAKKIILTGSIIIEEAGKYFNRLIWMLPNGTFGYYDKRHLFAFAGEDKQYTAGTNRLIASVKGWKINLQVCYDLRFPVWARQAQAPSQPPPEGEEKNPSPNAVPNVRSAPLPPEGEEIVHSKIPEYDLLIYVANWPERRSLAWKTLLQARAIENQCYTIGVNRVGNDGNNIYHSGDSMITDPMGEILYHKKDEEDIFTVTLNKTNLNTVREKFPFLLDADDFSISI